MARKQDADFSTIFMGLDCIVLECSVCYFIVYISGDLPFQSRDLLPRKTYNKCLYTSKIKLEVKETKQQNIIQSELNIVIQVCLIFKGRNIHIKNVTKCK